MGHHPRYWLVAVVGVVIVVALFVAGALVGPIGGEPVDRNVPGATTGPGRNSLMSPSSDQNQAQNR
jgi:hypothetical protein